MKNQNPAISKGIEWSLVWIYLVLVAVGITAIFAVTYKTGDPVLRSFLQFKTDYSKEFYFFAFSLVLAFFILLTDSKFFAATANLGYALGIFLLLLVFPFHSRIKGTESIIRLGAFNFQPAEFCKIFVSLALAKYLSRPEIDFSKTRSQLTAAALIMFPAMLCLLQHEMGLALVYFSFLIVMYREGLPPQVLLIGFAIVVLFIATIVVQPNILAFALTAVAFLLIYFFRKQIRKKRRILFNIILLWTICVGIQRFAAPYIFKHVLKQYQVERIFDLFGKDNPYKRSGTAVLRSDIEDKKKENGSRYNVKQSKIAIGSGNLFGKGLFQATQTRYGFVPEQRTDFIFDTVGEGFGFVGCFVLLGLYLFLLLRIVAIAERQRSAFSRCYAYGVAAVFFFHVLINVCMTIGLAPVIGIPLPFISYGGTSLLTFTIMLFILIRLDADRQNVIR